MSASGQSVSAADIMRWPIGFGTGRAGDAAASIVSDALQAGYRHIDTARKYGSEEGVGAALRDSGIPRGEIFLTTKVSHEHLRPDDFERSTETSLTALGVDFVDMLMIHWPTPDMNLAETMQALARMKERGLARAIGVANFNIALLQEAARLSPEPLAALQAEYHPFLDQSKVLETCRGMGLNFIAYCPLARGRVFREPVLAEIASARGRTVSQIVLRWLIQQEGVIAIPSSSDPSRMNENLDVFDFTLADDEMRRIYGLAKADGRGVNPPGRAPVWDS